MISDPMFYITRLSEINSLDLTDFIVSFLNKKP